MATIQFNISLTVSIPDEILSNKSPDSLYCGDYVSFIGKRDCDIVDVCTINSEDTENTDSD